MAEQETLMTFPCDFQIKAIGKNTPELEKTVLSIAHRHVPDLKEGCLEIKPSKQNKYLSINIKAHVTNKAQLDAIYQDLSNSDQIIMAL